MPEVVFRNGSLYCKVIYSVTQNITNNTSTITVSLANLQFKGGSSPNAGTAWVLPGGTIKINGETMCTSYDTSTQGISIGSFSNAEYRNVSIVGAGEWSGNKSITISHDDMGNANPTFAVSFSIGGRRTGGGLVLWDSVNAQESVSLPTIGRASAITSSKNITLGNSCSVKWTPKSSSFRYKIRFSLGSWSATTGAIYPNQTSEYTYTAYTIPLSVAYQLPNTTMGTMNAVLLTFSDDNCTTQVGSDSAAVNFTVTIPSNVIPIITGVTATIVNDNETVDGWGAAIASMTKVQLSGDVYGIYGATISSYKITGGYTVTTTTWPYTGPAVNKSGNVTFTVQVTDSRGRKSTAVTTQAIPFIAYLNPSILSFTVNRDAASPTIAYASAVFSFSSVRVNNVEKNSVTALLSYKKSSDTAWTYVVIVNEFNFCSFYFHYNECMKFPHPV